jgi:hypothetical protein
MSFTPYRSLDIDRYNIPTEVVFFCTNYCRDSRLLHAVCDTVL